MDSPHFGVIHCPYCEFQVCVHQDGWHLEDNVPENPDFDQMDVLVKAHTKMHTDRGDDPQEIHHDHSH